MLSTTANALRLAGITLFSLTAVNAQAATTSCLGPSSYQIMMGSQTWSSMSVGAGWVCTGDPGSLVAAATGVAAAGGGAATGNAVTGAGTTTSTPTGAAATLKQDNVYTGNTSPVVTGTPVVTTGSGAGSESTGEARPAGPPAVSPFSSLTAGGALPTPSCAKYTSPSGGAARNVAYYEVYDGINNTKQWDAGYIDEVTHVILAFGDMTVTPWAFPYQNMFYFPGDSDLRAKGAKLMGCLGGWMLDAPFQAAMQSDEAMIEFANNVAQFMWSNNLDGIDLDFEYPGSTTQGAAGGDDPSQYTKWPQLVSTIRAAIGCEAILSVAVPGVAHTDGNAAGTVDLWAWSQPDVVSQVDALVDFWNVMSYDLTNRYSLKTGPHVSLEGSIESAEAYIANGVPVEKINIGFATYAKAFPLSDPTSCVSPYIGCPMPSMGAQSDPLSDSFRFNPEDNGNWNNPPHAEPWWDYAVNALAEFVLPTDQNVTAQGPYYMGVVDGVSYMSDMYVDNSNPTYPTFWSWPTPYAQTQICQGLATKYPTISLMSISIGQDSVDPNNMLPHFVALADCRKGLSGYAALSGPSVPLTQAEDTSTGPNSSSGSDSTTGDDTSNPADPADPASPTKAATSPTTGTGVTTSTTSTTSTSASPPV